MNEKPDNFTAIVALVVAWSCIVFMFGYVIGASPT